MELDEILSNLVSNVDGANGAAVGGMDGLLVEQFPTDARVPLSSIVAENANLLRGTGNAYTTVLELGKVNELIVQSEKLLGYIRPVSNDFFLTLTLEPTGNLGKARLMSNEAVRLLKEVLG